MSHVTNVKLRVKDLDALEEAVDPLGLKLNRNQTRHKWFERFVGDSPIPAGMRPEDYGKCEHALVLKNATSSDYEIGLVKALDGGDGYDLVVDTWQQQRLLAAVGGAQFNAVRREYAAAVAAKRAKAVLAKKGFKTERIAQPNGGIRVRLTRR